MPRGVKKRSHEKLTDTNIRHVMQLLDAESPITKKEACSILNISYNTTRLKTIIEEYKENRDKQVNSHKVESFSDFSANNILQYYDDSVPKECGGKPNYRLGYTLGMLTVEILSAIGGSESTMKIYELAAIGQTFEEAFANVYGISWAEAKPILADLTASLHEDVYM